MSDLIIEVEEGKLRGKTSVDYKGRNFYSFQGIPYASPPIKELRFKSPVPPKPWDGIRDATKEASESISRHLFHRHPIGSEDCLYLNVYTPKLPNAGAKLNVMVFLHGGGFLKGSGNTDVHGPDYLITGDIVLVIINYRLGILGFLSLEDSSLGVPGNAGLRDMVMALKWVQKNIHNFNGDHNNVTIFGESAGASSVHLLMLSPMAKGLFHRAIMQSGCALNPWATGKRNVSEIAQVLGYNGQTEKDILNFLKTIPGEKFLEAQDIISNTLSPDKPRPFGPIIENPSNEQAFICEHPIVTMMSGNYTKVPLMIGYASREGMYAELDIKRRYGYLKMFTDFETKVPYFYNLEKGSLMSIKFAKKIKEFYYGDDVPSVENIDKLYILETDILFLRGIYISMKHMLEHVTPATPIYLYRLSVDSELNLYKKFTKITSPGVCHADDLGYLFKNTVMATFKPNTLEDKSVHRIVKLWTNFARYGNPNPKEIDPLINVVWEPLIPKHQKYRCLEFGEDLEATINTDLDRMHLWNDISNTVNLSSQRISEVAKYF